MLREAHRGGESACICFSGTITVGEKDLRKLIICHKTRPSGTYLVPSKRNTKWGTYVILNVLTATVRYVEKLMNLISIIYLNYPTIDKIRV